MYPANEQIKTKFMKNLSWYKRYSLSPLSRPAGRRGLKQANKQKLQFAYITPAILLQFNWLADECSLHFRAFAYIDSELLLHILSLMLIL